MLSLQASYAAPLILLAQNRQEIRDQVIDEQDRQANARAHADMEFLAREVASLRMALGEVATRDFLRSELRSLLSDLEELNRADEDESGPHRRATCPPRRLGHMTPRPSTRFRLPWRRVNDPEIKRPITDLGMVEHSRRRRHRAWST